MELPNDTLRKLCRLQVRVCEVCRASTAECTQSGVCGRVQDLRRSTFEASVWERTGPGTAWPLPKGMDSFHRASDERWRRTDAVTTFLERRGPGPRSGLERGKKAHAIAAIEDAEIIILDQSDAYLSADWPEGGEGGD